MFLQSHRGLFLFFFLDSCKPTLFGHPLCPLRGNLPTAHILEALHRILQSSHTLAITTRAGNTHDVRYHTGFTPRTSDRGLSSHSRRPQDAATDTRHPQGYLVSNYPPIQLHSAITHMCTLYHKTVLHRNVHRAIRTCTTPSIY